MLSGRRFEELFGRADSDGNSLTSEGGNTNSNTKSKSKSISDSDCAVPGCDEGSDLGKLRKLILQHDPDGKFRNEFVERYVFSDYKGNINGD